ncbi:hypothetical protein C8F01DRAFT_1376060, partial [Mycena amicta]
MPSTVRILPSTSEVRCDKPDDGYVATACVSSYSLLTTLNSQNSPVTDSPSITLCTTTHSVTPPLFAHQLHPPLYSPLPSPPWLVAPRTSSQLPVAARPLALARSHPSPTFPPSSLRRLHLHYHSGESISVVVTDKGGRSYFRNKRGKDGKDTKVPAELLFVGEVGAISDGTALGAFGSSTEGQGIVRWRFRLTPIQAAPESLRSCYLGQLATCDSIVENEEANKSKFHPGWDALVSGKRVFSTDFLYSHTKDPEVPRDIITLQTEGLYRYPGRGELLELPFDMYGVPWDPHDALGWNAVPGPSRGDGHFDIASPFPSTSTSSAPASFPGARHAQSYSIDPSPSFHPHASASHSGFMFPSPSSSSDIFGRGQYAEPMNYPPQFPALAQQLDIERAMDFAASDAPQHDPWTVFMRAELERHDSHSSSRSAASSPIYYDESQYPTESSTGRSTPFSDFTPWNHDSESLDLSDGIGSFAEPMLDSGEAYGGQDDHGSPLKFVERCPPPEPHASASAGSPSPPLPRLNDVDMGTVQNLFDDCVWQRSDTTWLDEGVWSEFLTFPDGIQVTSRKPIRRLERVHGVPSEIPFLDVETAFIITAPDSAKTDGMTIDNLFRDGCPHSFGTSSTGGRKQADTHLPGLLFPGRDPSERIAVRRAVTVCSGLLACESLDPAFIEGRQGVLDPDAKQKLLQARLRSREMQDNTRISLTNTRFLRSLARVHCRGRLSDGTVCKGTGVVEKLAKKKHERSHAITCSERHTELDKRYAHLSLSLPVYIDEGILEDAVAGKRIIDGDDEDKKCAMTLSRRSNKKNGNCPTNHSKDGKAFTAKLRVIDCNAKMTLFCPDEQRYPALALTCIAVPDLKRPHVHLTAVGTRCPHAVQDQYKAAVREFGAGATVAK